MKQQRIHFVGLDVHQSTVVASVRDESGKVVMQATVATEEKAVVALLRSWLRVHVAFEGGTQAQWLHDVLIDQVERVVACNVRGKGPLANKDDRIDADAMSEGLRVGAPRPVFHVPRSCRQRLAKWSGRPRRLLASAPLQIRTCRDYRIRLLESRVRCACRAPTYLCYLLESR